MDQIFDRLGNLLRSVFRDGDSLDDEDRDFSDPDMQAAWDELNDFINSGDTSTRSGTGFRDSTASERARRRVPDDVTAAYKDIGVPVGTPIVDVAKAYKQLLLKSHPDRFASDPARYSAATEYTKRINASFQKIKRYHETAAS